jgi:hypothetical protein
MSMNDGNKESAKELLATFRTIGSIGLAAMLLFLGLAARGEVVFNLSSRIAIACLAVSLALTVYLFLVVIHKIWREIDDIIDSPDVRRLSLLILASFSGGLLLLLVSLR